MGVIPTIRTSPPNTRRDFHDGDSRLRLIAKLLREIVTSRLFPEFADVKDALRRRLSSLRITYTAREFDDAYSVVGSNLPIVAPPTQPAPPQPLIETPLSHQDAAVIVALLRTKLKGRIALRSMPPARLMRPGHADRIKAAQMVAAEIVASVARCEARKRDGQ